MNMETTFPSAPPGRLAQFIRMVDAFSPAEIAAAVDVLIAKCDSLAGDPDLEPDEDRCEAGDGKIFGGRAVYPGEWSRREDAKMIGDDEDAEPGHHPRRRPKYGRDQSRGPIDDSGRYILNTQERTRDAWAREYAPPSAGHAQ